jgi:hypothetical protein
MQIHLVLGLNGPASVATLEANITKEYEGRYKRLSDRPAWLVADDSPARNVSEKLGINTGDGGISALVTTVADYFGRAEPELWAWIKLQWENQQDGSAAPTSNAA